MRVATSAPRVASFSCSLEVVVAVLGGKWKPGILFNLLGEPMRFAELRRKLGVSEKVLAQQLRELEAHGVVRREASGDVPPRVTYSLTRYGRTLRPILERMGRWGDRHLARLRAESVDQPPRASRAAASAASSSTSIAPSGHATEPAPARSKAPAPRSPRRARSAGKSARGKTAGTPTTPA